ncbi:gliding motility-associated C-terminal domain-containing protein [Emticicia sp. 17c]|uniref:gliding motility-associated C-terminal domain-containing protein n=1 Tax=Emticicia sp. 17c TaxID=3127704 RepID=UPI00301DFFF3
MKMRAFGIFFILLNYTFLSPDICLGVSNDCKVTESFSVTINARGAYLLNESLSCFFFQNSIEKLTRTVIEKNVNSKWNSDRTRQNNCRYLNQFKSWKDIKSGKWNVTHVADTTYIYIPDAFTPNDDRVNDLFVIKISDMYVLEYHIYIFNQWGNILFESDDLGNSWDGKVNGEYATPGAYAYKVTLTDKNGFRYQKFGKLMLFR